MKQREWWIYQNRKDESPWAIHLFATKHYRSIQADSEIYADWIPSASKRLVLGHRSITNHDGWITAVGNTLESLGHPLTTEDRSQLESEMEMLKDSFKH